MDIKKKNHEEGVQCWMDLSGKAVESLSLEVFRPCPGKAIGDLVQT